MSSNELRNLNLIWSNTSEIYSKRQIVQSGLIHSSTHLPLEAQEKKEGFIESKINIKTGKKIPFFNLGPKNTWKNILDEEIRKKIEIQFRDEMIELGYL